MAARVQEHMGTVVSVDVREPDLPVATVEPAVAAFFGELAVLEARFSPWRTDSAISRFGRGELAHEDAPPDVRWVLGACEHLRATTAGAFDARATGGPFPFDPSGLVKGWAVEEASRHLVEAGIRNYSVNAGGDILARGAPEPGRPWRVGIRHPERSDCLAAVLEVGAGAVATSGLYERGDHIRDVRSGQAPRELRSLTVVGPELTWADAYATSAFAMGMRGLEWVHARAGYGALAITADDRLVWTPTIASILMNVSGSSAVMVA
jgi:thiamine biosynthesis lipoprotein